MKFFIIFLIGCGICSHLLAMTPCEGEFSDGWENRLRWPDRETPEMTKALAQAMREIVSHLPSDFDVNLVNDVVGKALRDPKLHDWFIKAAEDFAFLRPAEGFEILQILNDGVSPDDLLRKRIGKTFVALLIAYELLPNLKLFVQLHSVGEQLSQRSGPISSTGSFQVYQNDIVFLNYLDFSDNSEHLGYGLRVRTPNEAKYFAVGVLTNGRKFAPRLDLTSIVETRVAPTFSQTLISSSNAFARPWFSLRNREAGFLLGINHMYLKRTEPGRIVVYLFENLTQVQDQFVVDFKMKLQRGKQFQGEVELGGKQYTAFLEILEGGDAALRLSPKRSGVILPFLGGHEKPVELSFRADWGQQARFPE